MSLHKIDRPNGGYKPMELEEFMVFCIIDTAVPYRMVCKTFDKLKEYGYTTKRGLRLAEPLFIKAALTEAGYRFPDSHSKRLKEFGRNKINLKTATREELVNGINGIGMKLASMFLRNTRGTEYAVLDVHTLRWLQSELGLPDYEYKKLKYEEKEKKFLEIAERMGKDPIKLDLEIWESSRVKERKA